jgi:hypothetical protein
MNADASLLVNAVQELNQNPDKISALLESEQPVPPPSNTLVTLDELAAALSLPREVAKARLNALCIEPEGHLVKPGEAVPVYNTSDFYLIRTLIVTLPNTLQ